MRVIQRKTAINWFVIYNIVYFIVILKLLFFSRDLNQYSLIVNYSQFNVTFMIESRC